MKKKLRRRLNNRPLDSVSLTPLCDVSLVLLIILMVIVPFVVQSSGILVSHAETSYQSESQGKDEKKPVDVSITPDVIKIQEHTAACLTSFESYLRNITEVLTPAKAVVTAEKAVELGKVVSVLDILRENGLENLFIKKQ